ncbi:MAG: pyridoxamine 5'-phosphate oxidase [Bacteroidales bacterium]|nr:pyridoxamine 5'-phosphate oxidase [Bacteroidales bacterium]
MNLDQFRKEYRLGELKDDSLEPDPILQFAGWFKHAAEILHEEVTTMILATATAEGKPSARIVLLKDFDERGFTFITNYQGRKGRELEENPYAAILFYWNELERQVRIEGKVEHVSDAESDDYFNKRPTESKISAVISPQSQPVESRQVLEDKWVNFLKDNFGKEIQRPHYWGGFRLVPDRVEFWQGRINRLHDRFLYTRTKNGWKIERLAP